MKPFLSLIFTLLLLGFMTNTFAQKVQWSKFLIDSSQTFTTSSDRKIQGFTIDSLNNSYVCYILPGSDTTISFISKVSPDGELMWTRTVEPVNMNGRIQMQYSSNSSFYTDVDGNLVLVIDAWDTLLNPGMRILLYKFDLNGNLVSSHSHGINLPSWFPSGSEGISNIVIRDNGEIFVPLIHSEGMQDDSANVIIYGFDKQFNSIFYQKNTMIADLNEMTYLSYRPQIYVNDSAVYFSYYMYDLSTYALKSYLVCSSINTGNIQWKYSNVPEQYMNLLFEHNDQFCMAGNNFLRFDDTGTIINASVTNAPYGPTVRGDFLYGSKINFVSPSFPLATSSAIVRLNLFTNTIDSFPVHANTYNAPIAGGVMIKDSFIYCMGSILDDTLKFLGPTPTLFFNQYDTLFKLLNTTIFKLRYNGWSYDRIMGAKFDKDGNILIAGSCYTVSRYDSSILNIRSETLIFIAKICYDCNFNLNGNVYVDLNSNCLPDSSETKLEGQMLRLLPESIYTMTDSNGLYSFSKDHDSAHIELIPSYTSVGMCNNVTNYNLSVAGMSTDSLHFGYDDNTALFDCSSYLTHGAARPGFNFTLVSSVLNKSLRQGLDLVHCITYDSIFQFLNATPPPDSISNNLLFWKTDTLEINEKKLVVINLILPASVPLSTPFTNISSCSVNNDVNPGNNNDTAMAVVVGSFDPNDKSAQPLGLGDEHYISKEQTIKYTIRFQNTGTDTALNIRVFDDIDSDLDLSTLQILSSTHKMFYNIHNRTLKFYFNDIFLPDSNKNYALSNGMISYSIKPYNIPDGSIIKNKADIYFDYNIPVTTNTTKHTIGHLPDSLPADINLTIFPNPASNLTHIRFTIPEEGNYKIVVSDLSGRIVDVLKNEKMPVGKFEFTTNLSALPQGSYFISLSGKRFRKAVKLLVSQ